MNTGASQARDEGAARATAAAAAAAEAQRAARSQAGEPPGLRSQLGSTFDAGKRLLRAHVDLGKAEMGDIMDEVKRMLGLAGAAVGMLILAALLLFIGGLLFLGEWLFGSIGWGALLGFLLLLDLALVLLLLALDVKAGRVGGAFAVALILGIIVGVLLALNLTNRGWTALGDAVASGYDPATRTVLLAIGVSAAVLGILGFLMRIRGGIGSAIGGLVLGALVGALIGGLTVIELPVSAAAATGVLVTLIAWPVLAARDVMREGIDGEALKKKFTPEETIGLTKETIEWVRARTPLVPKS